MLKNNNSILAIYQCWTICPIRHIANIYICDFKLLKLLAKKYKSSARLTRLLYLPPLRLFFLPFIFRSIIFVRFIFVRFRFISRFTLMNIDDSYQMAQKPLNQNTRYQSYLINQKRILIESSLGHKTIYRNP